MRKDGHEGHQIAQGLPVGGLLSPSRAEGSRKRQLCREACQGATAVPVSYDMVKKPENVDVKIPSEKDSKGLLWSRL